MDDFGFETGSVAFSAELLVFLLKIRQEEKEGCGGRGEPVEPQVSVPTLILARGEWWRWCLDLSQASLSS